MNSRERILMALRHKEPDCVPIFDLPWPATIDRWRGEGLPTDVDLAAHFGWDLVMFEADTSAMFPTAVLEENERYITQTTRFGEVVRVLKDQPHVFEMIKPPCKTRNLTWSPM